VAESDLAGTTKSEYIFFDGERVARRDGPTGTGGVFYYFSDHLKTASVITDSAGVIKAESDYYPWGGELQFVNNDSNDYKFTGKERDTETGLDYFGARYYSNGLGRFITSDFSAVPVPVPYADLIDPQSLNQYSYVRNVPTVKVDLDGHGCPPVCDLPTPTAHDLWLIKEAGKGLFRRVLESSARVTVGTAIIIGAYAASPYIQTVGQSNADEIAERDRLDAENAQKLGQARGADEDKSQSDIVNERARTNGGLADVHGNSHATDKPAQGYSLRDKDTGEVLKYGETTRGTARYTKEYLDKNNARMQFEANGTKKEMHQWQHDKIQEYREQHDGARPPLNKNDY
jgi:RHS repeat-associated protein